MKKRVIIQTEDIDIAALTAQLGTAEDGAVVTFIGRARNNSMGKGVDHLDYEIYNSMAIKELQKIADEAMEKWPITMCFIVHRYGPIAIGEASIFIGVSSPHRKEAYESSSYLIDEIKRRVPVWKKEFYRDGSSWITPKDAADSPHASATTNR